MFTKRFRAFYLIFRKYPNPSQHFCYSHSLNFGESVSPESVSKQPTQLIIAAHNCRAVARGGLWGLQPPTPPMFGRTVNPILTRGGQIMPTTVLQAPSIFQTLRRPCTYVRICKIVSTITGISYPTFTYSL